MTQKISLFLTSAALTLGFASSALADVTLVDESQLNANCQYLGQYEGDAGYGKQIDGKQIALFRAKKKAEKAGANYVSLVVLNGGPSGLNGYARVKGFTCAE